MAIHSSKCADPETCNEECIYQNALDRFLREPFNSLTAPIIKPTANLCLASEDDLIYPWRDLYPLAGQTVQHDGEEWCVLRSEAGGHYRKLYRSDVIDGREFIVVVPRTDCRPLGWTLMDELTLDLQALADTTGLDVVVVVADLGE